MASTNLLKAISERLGERAQSNREKKLAKRRPMYSMERLNAKQNRQSQLRKQAIRQFKLDVGSKGTLH